MILGLWFGCVEPGVLSSFGHVRVGLGEVAKSPDGGGARVQRYEAQLGEITLEAESHDGPVSVTALSRQEWLGGPGASPPEPVAIELRAGVYTEPRIIVGMVRSGDRPALFAEGREANVVFEATVAETLHIPVAGLTELVVPEEGMVDVGVLVDPAQWTLDISVRDIGPNPVVLPHDAPELWEIFVQNVERSGVIPDAD